MTSVKRKRILRLAIRKCRRFSDTKEYCGCLTPSEIFTLINAGVLPACSKNHTEWLKEQLKKGLGNPIWFYFYPNNVDMNN